LLKSELTAGDASAVGTWADLYQLGQVIDIKFLITYREKDITLKEVQSSS